METELKYRRGDWSECGQMRFWLGPQKSNRRSAIWLSRDEFNARKKKHEEYLKGWREQHRQKVLKEGRARAAKWVRDNPERHSENRKRWERENREKKNRLSRASYQKHKAKRNAYQRAYTKAHPEKKNLYTAARRARLLASAHPEHDRKIELVLRESRRRVSGCLGVIFELDHLIPLSKGGWHHHLNLIIIPRSLNRSKSVAPWQSLPENWHPHPQRVSQLTLLGVCTNN